MINGKKVLFVLRRAGMGGSCASMINLLSLYQEQGITFDVFLMEHTGEWTKEVAKYANLLPEDTALAAAIKTKSQLHGVGEYVRRIAFVLSHKLQGRNAAIEKVYRAAAKKLSGLYDHVIAYQESESTEFASHISAPHKIAWVHTDFERFWKSRAIGATKAIYDAFQDVVCVTDASAKSVMKNLGYEKERVWLIRNTLPTGRIRARATEAVPEAQKKPFLFVSVGRLSEEKGYDRIPQAARILADKGIEFDWYLVGDGASRRKIEAEVIKWNVEGSVHLLGAKMNPYSYVAMADCIVITSHYEAQPMVANEALILDKPVISTEFTSVYEVIKDGENGMIVQQTPEAIADALEKFVTDGEHREKLQNGAKAFCYSNQQELDAFTQLLG